VALLGDLSLYRAVPVVLMSAACSAAFSVLTAHISGSHGRLEGKGKGLDTCYSAAYMSQTRDQQHFTILEAAADWHKPQRIMWPFVARANGQLGSRPAEGRSLSLPEHIVG